MKRSVKKSLLCLISIMLITGGCLLSASAPSGMIQESPEETFAPILGSYEFDMSAFGWGILNIRFFLEDGKLWTQTDMSNSPAEMLRVDEKLFEFMVEDPDEGRYDIIFKQDETGNYAQCRIKNPTQDMDVTGNKVK